MFSFSHLASTVARALGLIRHPTRGMKSMIAQLAFRSAAVGEKAFSSIKTWAADQLVLSGTPNMDQKIRHAISTVAKEKLMDRLDPLKRVPRQMMVEARLAEKQSYLVTFRVQKRYEGMVGTVEEYVSLWTDTMLSPEGLFVEFQTESQSGKYKPDYEVAEWTLARVTHRIGAKY